MAQCNYWNVNYITFQWFTIGLFSKYTKTKYKKGSKINTIIYTLKHGIATYYHITHFNDTYAKILHIPPASLADYYDFYMPLPLSGRHIYLSEQRHLEEDINSVNKYISNLNHKYRKRSVKWNKELQKSKQKRKGRSKKVKTSLTFKCLIEHLLADFSYSRPLDTYL